MKTAVIISTYNRRDLTGITLDAVMACKDATTTVHVIDDGSDEYGVEWLKTFGVDHIDECVGLCGVGEAARRRLLHFIETDADIAVMLDNDALVVPRFDTFAVGMYTTLRSRHGAPLITTLYRSTYHEPIEDQPFDPLAIEMKDIGGISLVMDRSTARHLLDSIETWDSQWDFQLHKHARVFAPHVSYVEHIGRHGSGVNGHSPDRAVNFIGYGGMT